MSEVPSRQNDGDSEGADDQDDETDSRRIGRHHQEGKQPGHSRKQEQSHEEIPGIAATAWADQKESTQ